MEFEMDKVPTPVNTDVTSLSSSETSNENAPLDKQKNRRQFWKVEPQLIPFKLFYFAFFGAIGCIFPYFSLYYKQLGFSPNQIGLISGVRPLIGFCSGPIWGTIADRYRIRRILLLCSTVGWLTFLLGVGFVPPPETTDTHCPKKLNLVPNLTLTNDLTLETLNDISPPSKPGTQKVPRKEKPGVSYYESLLEDRSWMFIEADINKIFVIIILLIICGEIVQSPASALADAGCLSHIGNEHAKYGVQRSWGSIGFGLLSMVVGGVISTTRTKISVCGINIVIGDYRVAFYFFIGCMVVTFIAAWFFRFKDETEEHKKHNPVPDIFLVFRFFKSPHYGSWLFCIFVMGVCNGVIWGFLNWHLENIGASQFLIGCATITQNVSEVFMFFIMFPILDRIGYFTFMVLGIMGYALRFCVFALLEDPWWVLPVEILQGFTFAGVWGALIGYLCSAIPIENMTALQGILHGVYWGLGSGSGAMIGGIVTEHYGARVTFWAFAVTSAVNLIIFVLAQKLSPKPKTNYKEMDT